MMAVEYRKRNSYIARALAAVLALLCLACATAVPAEAHAEDHVAAAAELGAPTVRIAEGTYRITSSASPKVALVCPRGSSSKGLQMKAAKAGSSASQKFYVRDEGDGLVSLQSVASGLFLGQVGGKVVQLPDASSADRRWRPTDDSGIAFVNAQTGQVLALNGGKAKAGVKAVACDDEGTSAQRWRLTGVKLVSNGYYKMKSSRGGFLAAAKGSYAPGAKLRVYSAGAKKAEVFKVSGNEKGWCRFESTRTFLTVSAKGSGSSSAPIVQKKGAGTSSQLWKAALDRSGNLVFKNKKTKNVMGISSKPKRSGVTLRQGRYTGKSGQAWELVKTKRYSLSGDKALDRAVASILADYPTLRKAYDHVAFDYRYISGNVIRSGKYLSKAKSVSYAKQFIRNGGGNCYRFSSAMMWLARGLGYSSKVVTGWVPGYQVPRAPHGWCEVYRNGKTYLCDPDMYNAVRNRNWYMRTYANAPVAYGFW